MGEIAEMMLDGTLCTICGEYLGTDDGFPVTCASCGGYLSLGYQEPAKKVKCSVCGKKVKEIGLNDHMRDKHSVKGIIK